MFMQEPPNTASSPTALAAPDADDGENLTPSEK